MNWEQIQGKWEQVKGSVVSEWGKFTDDEVDEIRGDRDKLVGKIREQYGVAKEDAERQVDRWLAKF